MYVVQLQDGVEVDGVGGIVESSGTDDEGYTEVSGVEGDREE